MRWQTSFVIFYSLSICSPSSLHPHPSTSLSPSISLYKCKLSLYPIVYASNRRWSDNFTSEKSQKKNLITEDTQDKPPIWIIAIFFRPQNLMDFFLLHDVHSYPSYFCINFIITRCFQFMFHTQAIKRTNTSTIQCSVNRVRIRSCKELEADRQR